jgi:hypothetical protein
MDSNLNIRSWYIMMFEVIPGLLPELVELIFNILSSKTRSEICSVSKMFNIYSIKVSKQLSEFPELYDNDLPDQYYIMFNIIVRSKDYHLLTRMKYGGDISLCTACSVGDIDIIDTLISRGARYWDGGLYGACLSGRMNLIELMISKGANDWNYGLSAACQGDHKEIIKLMISKGAYCCSWCLKSMDYHLAYCSEKN